MNKKMMAYEAPKTEALELLAEGVICQSSNTPGNIEDESDDRYYEF